MLLLDRSLLRERERERERESLLGVAWWPGLMESIRKAYGALKDSTSVGLVKVNNSQFKDLDIAIVKATNHVESPPKERHVRKIFSSVLVSCPRADVGYCIYALSKRLAKTRSWIVSVKTLIVIHRILREGDPSFRDQLMLLSRRGAVFQISNSKDDSTSLAWDCSAWVRTYALYLEERIECFRKLEYDVEVDRVQKSAHHVPSKCKIDMSTPQKLLENLPSLQQLLYRILCCQPEGFACANYLIQYALALVVKESFKVYCAINDGIVNLVDLYFEMPSNEATKALDIYKKAGRQADHLADFYSFCKTLELGQTFQFPTLRQPPPSFIATMEEYIKEAPQARAQKKLEIQNTKEEPQNPEEIEEEVKQVDTEKHVPESIKEETKSEITETVLQQVTEEPFDLLGLNEVSPEAKQIEESNALALAIIQPGNDFFSTNSSLTGIEKSSGWELALVTQPSSMNNKPQATQSKFGGSFDSLLLDSLYEDEASRRQLELHRAGYSMNSYAYNTSSQYQYNQHDTFGLSAPQANAQLALTYPQQQQQMSPMMPPQQSMMGMSNPYAAAAPQYYQQQRMMMRSTNPFEDPFMFHPQNATMLLPNANYTLL